PQLTLPQVKPPVLQSHTMPSIHFRIVEQATIFVVLAVAAWATVYHIPLDSHSNFSWTLDYPSSRLQVEVHVPKLRDEWFAVGFSDYGQLPGADLCVMWEDWKRNVHFQTESICPGNMLIIVDSQQDCLAFRHVTRGNISKFTFRRDFDTCDDQDYVIEEGTTHIVWARGKGPLFRLEGLNISGHGNMQRVQLLKNPNPPTALPPDTWKHEIINNAVKVPGDDTTYWCKVHQLPPELRTKHHVVQYEAVIQPGNEALVHHMEVFHCEVSPEQHMPQYEGSCFSPDRPEPTQACKRVLAAWAMGALPFTYPEEAGLPIGGPQFNLYVMLEVHYNNPELKTDWVDSSGVRMYLSPTLRQYDGGVIELGLEYTDKMAIPPAQPHFQLTGYCITECTAVAIPQQGITIFASQLHTHLTGVRVFTKHIRDGRELPELNRDNHYSTHFQVYSPLKRRVQVLPGDALLTECWYDTTDRTNITLGGFAISEEMCVNYVHYFPKIDLEVCKSSVSYDSLHTYFRFLHEKKKLIKKDDNDKLKTAVQWTPMRRTRGSSRADTTRIPLSMQCNQHVG
ncbi:hypothetical protein L9F63_025529, partial [Diploptera punctata]